MNYSALDLQPESDTPAKPPEQTPSATGVETADTVETAPTKETIVLDGPLSTIYTQALQIAYSKEAPIKDDEETPSIAKEKMAIDASMMGVMEVVDTEGANSPKPLYVYVTDTEHLDTADAVPGTFDALHVAVESGRYQGVWFCTADGHRLSRAQCHLSDFVQSSGGRVFYSKKSLWRALGG